MAHHAKPIPEGYHAVTPHLIVSDAARAIEFYKRAFGAQEISRMEGPHAKIVHDFLIAITFGELLKDLHFAG